MDRQLSATLVVAFLALALTLMFLGWRSRTRQQAHLPRPSAVPADLGEQFGSFSGLYVATTRSGDRLERIAVGGLGFRSRVRVDVSDRGVALSIPGQVDSFVSAADLRAVGRSTWTIDRVVEDGGLIFIEWMLGDTAIESFFRMEEPEAFLDALRRVESLRTGHITS